MKNCGSIEGRFSFSSFWNSEHHYEWFPPCPFSIFIVRRYEVEEDGGSLQFRSIWQQAQINGKANMVLPPRVFQ